MIRGAVLVFAVALLATGCGSGGNAPSAADVAPANARALLSLPPQPEQRLTRRALRYLPGGAAVLALVDRGAWSRAAGSRVQLAELADGRLVAYAQLKDAKRLDAAGLVHERVRGWTVFAPTKSTLDEARSKRPLSDTAWFGPASAAAGTSGLTAVAPGWRAYEAADGGARRSTHGRGHDAPQPLTRDIPPDAVAAASSTHGAELVHALPLAGLGVRPSDLAAAAPRGGVLYARPGAPIPSITVLAQDGDVVVARRVVHELAPGAASGVREDVNGLPLEHVATGPVDLLYGRVGRTLVVTNDPQIKLGGEHLEPDGLPGSTSSWRYVDVARARNALTALTLIGGTGSLLRRFDAEFAGLSTFLTFTTHERGRQTVTVVLT